MPRQLKMATTIVKQWLVLMLLAGMAWSVVNASSSKVGSSKEYAIKAAKRAKIAYEYAEFGYFLKDQKPISQNINSAIKMLSSSISAIDSALLFATQDSSDLIGIDYANSSKQYSKAAKSILGKASQTNDAENKKYYCKKAIFLCGNATVDAYTASLYLSGSANTGEGKVKGTTTGKPFTKLEVDKALFLVLDNDFKRKEENTKKEIQALNENLNTTSDPEEQTKIKQQIQELEAKLSSVRTRRQETQKKYADIVELIRQEKQKNGESDTSNTTGTSGNPSDDLKTKTTTGTLQTTNDAWGETVVMDQVLPPGLFYKVQIGVYKNKIDPNVFHGITPITGEDTPNGIRYSAGMFTRLKDVKEALEYIKGLGYKDSFIAPYYNSQRITVAEAAKLEK